jgi:hypothetical protein
MLQQQQTIPWRGGELKRFWAMTRAAGIDRETIYKTINCNFRKERLHNLTRTEFIQLMSFIAKNQKTESKDKHFLGTPMEAPWRHIRYLQRQLGWSDEDLGHYISWHGKKVGTNIDNVRWLTVEKARAIITGMKKILVGSKSKEKT